LTPATKQKDIDIYIEQSLKAPSIRDSLSSVYVEPVSNSSSTTLLTAAGTAGGVHNSESMLWALIKIIVENNGLVRLCVCKIIMRIAIKSDELIDNVCCVLSLDSK
jgi:hypothetical protein